MGSTNKTTTLNLTQYVGSDTINFITDYNADMLKIDNFAAQKAAKNGLATLNSSGKLVQMPTASDVGALSTNDTRLVCVGTVTPYAGTSAPTGYLLCQGQAVSRTTYSALYNVIGIKYGAGNGSTTFNVPDLQTRVPVGYKSGDSNFGTVGGTGGSKARTLHALIGNPNGQTNQLGFTETSGVPNNVFTRRFEQLVVNNDASAISNTAGVVGDDGSPPSVLQPYTTMNYIIKY